MADSVMEFIEAWVREHINAERYQPFAGAARMDELARWLRMDAAASGISGTAIDAALAASTGAGDRLVNYISGAMAAMANLPVFRADAARLADEDV